MKTVLVLTALVALLSLAQASKTSKRCTWTLLRAISACKASCKVLGQTTGVCSPQDRCLCSGEDFDILDQVKDWIEEELSYDQISEKMSSIYQDIKDTVKPSFEWMKDITVSRCQLDSKGKFCRRTCHAVGRVDGVCNEDNTDCDCTDDTVSLKDFSKCASESVCRVYCQSKGKTTGQCTGETGWDCTCEGDIGDTSVDATTKFAEETTEGPVVFEEFSGSLRRRRRSLFGF